MKGQLTKEKITQSAKLLFNANGVKNVRLQHIANEAGLSVGNLAYHFPDKGHILRSIEQEISAHIHQLLSDWQQFSHFIDFDNQLSRFYHIFNTFSFYFLDILELKRSYPRMHQNRKEKIQAMIDQICLWLEANVYLQMLSLDDARGESRQLAEMIWFISAFWMTRNLILDQTDKEERAFKGAVWNQIRPYLTEKGESEFELLIQPGLISW